MDFWVFSPKLRMQTEASAKYRQDCPSCPSCSRIQQNSARCLAGSGNLPQPARTAFLRNPAAGFGRYLAGRIKPAAGLHRVSQDGSPAEVPLMLLLLCSGESDSGFDHRDILWQLQVGKPEFIQKLWDSSGLVTVRPQLSVTSALRTIRRRITTCHVTYATTHATRQLVT